MAPEQVSGADARAACDVFARGSTIMFAATGRPPFGSGSIPAVMYRVPHHAGGGDDDGPPPSGDPPPEAVVLGSPDPGRYCGTRGRGAEFRSGERYCVPRGGDIGVDTHITMTQVCASQYRPDAEARTSGGAGDPSAWECYVMR